MMFAKRFHKMLAVFLATMTVAFAAAGTVAAQDAAPDQPDAAEEPPETPTGHIGQALDRLPEQASDTARQVLTTISDTAGNIGEALQDLLGGGDE